jgi:ketosteroid isomerase-like protein
VEESANVRVVRQAYDLARRAKHADLRPLLHEDVRWDPAREGIWRPCSNADDVVRTLLFRAGVFRFRPAETVDLGDRVLVRLRGRGMIRLGARGKLFPRLYQIWVVRGGRIASIQDYPNRAQAHAAAGLHP